MKPRGSFITTLTFAIAASKVVPSKRTSDQEVPKDPRFNPSDPLYMKHFPSRGYVVKRTGYTTKKRKPYYLPDDKD